MPTYSIQGPDGKTYSIDGPEGATRDQVIDAIKSRHADAPGLLESAVKPITDIPSTYTGMVNDAVDQMGHGAQQIGQGGVGNILKGAGNMALGAVGYVSAPLNAPTDSIVGGPVRNATGSEAAGNVADIIASLILPIPEGLPRMSSGAAATAPARMMDVTLSEGQATRNLSSIQREQAAVRGTSGPPAQKVAQAFTDQQKSELAATKDTMARSFDPFGAKIAETPQEAGEVIQGGVQRAAASAKAGVDAAYDQARSLPGEIHAGAFEGIGQKIKGQLSLGPDPVTIDSKLTPWASHMIDDVEQRISQLKIENRANPFGAPNPENITGINLKGVDQMRRRLSTMRGDAFSSGNGSDARAAKAVLNAFDDHIDAAINGGLFTGDPRAIKAWNDARSANSDYRSTFSAGKNDPIGREVEKIIGKNNNPAATPNDVADFMYSSAGVNPRSLNVGVVTRVRKILGDKSPEWSAVKQGLFSRLIEPGPGQTEFGAGKVAQRLNRFMNSDGKEMANLVFSGAERDLISKYSDLMRHLEIPQAGANWSNTATFAGQGFKPSMTSRVLEFVGGKIGMAVGAVVGLGTGTVLGHLGVGELGGAAGVATAKIAGYSGQAMEARQIARQMPVISKTVNSFSAAARAAETSPTSRNVARLTLAAQNLVNNLKSIGVNLSPDDLLRAMQGPQPGSAQPTTPQTPVNKGGVTATPTPQWQPPQL